MKIRCIYIRFYILYRKHIILKLTNNAQIYNDKIEFAIKLSKIKCRGQMDIYVSRANSIQRNETIDIAASYGRRTRENTQRPSSPSLYTIERTSSISRFHAEGQKINLI